MDGARVVSVLPDVAGLDRTFDYLVPEAMDASVSVGTIVRVELHGRRVGGWVVADHVEPPPGVRLRPLAKVTGHGPPPDVVEVSSWIAWRWYGRRAAVLRAASPPRAVPYLPPRQAAGREQPGPPSSLSVTNRPPAAASDQNDGGPPPFRSLEAAGGPRVTRSEERRAGPADWRAVLDGPSAVVRIGPAGDRMPLIEAALERGPALILVPTGADAAALAGRLRRRGEAVAIVPHEWHRARAGECTVVGARSAALAPALGARTVLVLDAHDEAYQEERTPTWHARDVAFRRAQAAGVPFVAVSPCPDQETLAVGPLHVPDGGGERRAWAGLDTVDLRDEDPRSGLLSERLAAVLRGGSRVVCVLNRKGRARLVACAACEHLARCSACHAALSQADDGLRCPRCGTTQPPVCGGCGSQRLRRLRPGTTRLREEVEALVGEPVTEVTAEGTGGRDRGEAGHQTPETRVVIGTEAVLHRRTKADVIAFLDIDQELAAPRYRAAEQALALLARASRLVGGRSGGRVLVQTRLPDHEVLTAARQADPGIVARAEKERRAALGLPPHSALASISGAVAPEFAVHLRDASGLTVVEVGPGRWLARAPDHASLSAALAATPRPTGRLRVEVDPLRV